MRCVVGEDRSFSEAFCSQGIQLGAQRHRDSLSEQSSPFTLVAREEETGMQLGLKRLGIAGNSQNNLGLKPYFPWGGAKT